LRAGGASQSLRPHSNFLEEVCRFPFLCDSCTGASRAKKEAMVGGLFHAPQRETGEGESGCGGWRRDLGRSAAAVRKRGADRRRHSGLLRPPPTVGAWQGLVDGVMWEWDRTGRGYDPPGAAGLSVAVLSTRLHTSRRCRTSDSSQAGKEEARVCGEAGGGSCRRMSHRDSVWRVPGCQRKGRAHARYKGAVGPALCVGRCGPNADVCKSFSCKGVVARSDTERETSMCGWVVWGGGVRVAGGSSTPLDLYVI